MLPLRNLLASFLWVVAVLAAPMVPCRAAAPAETGTPDHQPDRIAAPAAPLPNMVKVGLFVTRINDLNMASRSFDVTFWGWYLTTDDKYKPLETVEIVNAKATTTRYGSVQVKEDFPWNGGNSAVAWTQGKYAATIAKDWNISN